jgi:hypothetical protein
MASFTKAEWRDACGREQVYKLTVPKQFGNLSERMQLVMALHRRVRQTSPRSAELDELREALLDLEQEVGYYVVVAPAYCQRNVPPRLR